MINLDLEPKIWVMEQFGDFFAWYSGIYSIAPQDCMKINSSSYSTLRENFSGGEKVIESPLWGKIRIISISYIIIGVDIKLILSLH